MINFNSNFYVNRIKNSMLPYRILSEQSPISCSGKDNAEDSLPHYSEDVSIPGFDLVNRNNLSSYYNPEELPKDVFEGIPVGKTIYQIIDRTLERDEKLGEGANSTVYQMPYLRDYVLKVLNKDDPNNIDIADFPADRNLGQPVWQSKKNPRMLILKKVNGENHSINNWNSVIWDEKIQGPHKITRKQAVLYLKKVKDLAGMEQQAFDSLAQDVKMLDEKGYKVDSVNPNNLIVDIQNRKMHIVDYFKVKPHEKEVYQNSTIDIASLAFDFTLLPEYFDKLDESEQFELISNICEVNEKIQIAGERCGLSSDSNKFLTFMNQVSKFFPTMNVKKDDGNGEYIRAYNVRAEDFVSLLDNPIKWCVER